MEAGGAKRVGRLVSPEHPGACHPIHGARMIEPAWPAIPESASMGLDRLQPLGLRVHELHHDAEAGLASLCQKDSIRRPHPPVSDRVIDFQDIELAANIPHGMTMDSFASFHSGAVAEMEDRVAVETIQDAPIGSREDVDRDLLQGRVLGRVPECIASNDLLQGGALVMACQWQAYRGSRVSSAGRDRGADVMRLRPTRYPRRPGTPRLGSRSGRETAGWASGHGSRAARSRHPARVAPLSA